MTGYGLGDRVALHLLGGVMLGRVIRVRPGPPAILRVLWDGEMCAHVRPLGWELPATCRDLTLLEGAAAYLTKPRKALVRGG